VMTVWRDWPCYRLLRTFVFDLVSALPASCFAFVLIVSSFMPRPFVQPPAIMVVPPVCGEGCAISRVVLSINGNTCSRHLLYAPLTYDGM
jgi:hypothetical protein